MPFETELSGSTSKLEVKNINTVKMWDGIQETIKYPIHLSEKAFPY
jgi:hypothetical protein